MLRRKHIDKETEKNILERADKLDKNWDEFKDDYDEALEKE